MNARGRIFSRVLLGAGMLSLLLAQPAHSGELPGPDDKPFAEAHIILQLSDGDAAVQSRVLNVASNLLKQKRRRINPNKPSRKRPRTPLTRHLF